MLCLKNIKKLLAIIICAAIVFCTLPFSTFTASAEIIEEEYVEFISGNYTYIVSNDEAIIVGFNKSYKGSVNIPETLGGYPVTRIDNFAFYGLSYVTDITLPETVVSIGYSAFHKTGFYNNADNWENEALYIDNFLIGVTTATLDKYEVKAGTKYIADYAFYSSEDATSFETVVLPDSVLRIGEGAFENCIALKNITFSKNITHIGAFAFLSCVSITDMVIPDSVIYIGDYAFQYCSSISNLVIGNNVAHIGDYAFQYCDLLKTVNIPENVDYLSEFAFQFCNILTDINVSENNAFYCSEDGVLFDKDKTKLINYPAGKNQTSYTVPDGVDSICDYAFQGADKLAAITLPDTVRLIGYRAFGDCTSLQNVNLGNGLKKIGETSFYRCSSLSEITIPDSTKEIGDYAFGHCTALYEINLPDDISKIGYSAFYNTAFYNNENNWENNVLYWGKFLIDSNPDLSGEYKIKEGTKLISDSAFYGCSMLTGVVIPGSVTTIGDSAFFGCDALKNVYFSGSKDEWNNIIISDFNETLSFSEITYDYVPENTPSAETLVMLKTALFTENQDLTLDFYADDVIDILDLITLKEILLK